ncbi:retrovirus-related Pol polyprotein from transposon TNT 1-94 [Trichonephila clavata]|uniref:Retrovirus-related Pol polyprotein from transposon TNT 1-94 n=1 Tax=Trichonephila clavata TaxID=2740835 RepID=A0A8X6FEL7_TRICU|nr:retrovirus-related Pol polyprotein from transposon TNT 1-94 [Trichonephila clavata]
MNALKVEYDLEWNFFAASHGKGAVDGISGSVKRSVWIAVKSRKAIVNSALEFYGLARSLSKTSSLYSYDLGSDSDNEPINEESPPTSHQASKSLVESCRKTDGTAIWMNMWKLE